jgi:DNA replication protein DnaC
MFEGEYASMFPCLAKFTQDIKKPSFTIQNRDEELRAIEAALNRPELCNVLLLGEPGSGKTALVQATMMKDHSRLYLEVDLSKMISDCNDVNEMATRLKTNLIQGYTNVLVKDVRMIDNRLFITIWHGSSQENSAIFYYNLS